MTPRIPRNLHHVRGYLHGFNTARRMLKEGGDMQAHFDAVCDLARQLPEPPAPVRQHRLEASYPTLWRAVAGAAKVACAAHADIQISDRRLPSLVKRIVGQLLALEARSGRPDETGPGYWGSRPKSDGFRIGQPPASSTNAGGYLHDRRGC